MSAEDIDRLQQPPAARGAPREVIVLAWPVVLNMLSITMMGTADTFFVGKIGTVEQGAVGFSHTLTWTFYCFFVGTLVITQTFVAQFTGAKQHRRAASWGSVGLHLAILFGLPPAIMGLFGEPLFTLCRVDAPMIPFAGTYFGIRMFGAVFFFLANVGDGYFRGIGDTVTPMVTTMVVNAVNVVLDPILIFGVEALRIPALGVAGAAYATVFATFLQTYIYWELGRRRLAKGKYAPRYRERTRFADSKEFLRVGAPSGLHWFLDIGAWTLFVMAVARLGAVQAAANLIGITIIRASFMPGYGVSTAAQTLVGQYLGGGDIRAAVRSGWTSVKLTCLYMGAMGVTFFFLRAELVNLFTDDPAVIAVGSRLMLWAALFQLCDGIQVVLAGALRGAGDTKYVMFVSLAASWAIFVPLTFVMMFVYGQGAEGGWFAVNAWVLALAAALIVRFRGRSWVRSRVTEREIVPEPRPVPDMEVA